MRSIHKRVGKWHWNVFVGALLSIAFITFIYINIVNPLFSHAESQYMTATVTDDNGEVDFSPGINDAGATFSYTRVGSFGADSQIYDAKITLQELPVDGTSKKLAITLPIGMVWVDDGSSSENLLSQLDASRGENGVEKIAIDHEPVKGHTFSGAGTRVYYFTEGASALTVSFKVKADNAVNTDVIRDAITAKLYIDDRDVEDAKLNVNIPTGLSTSGRFYRSITLYAMQGQDYQSDTNYYRRIESQYVIGRYDMKRIIQSISMNIHVDNPKAKIKLSTSDEQYALDDSDMANGNYKLTYTPNQTVNGVFNVPYYVSFDDDIEAGTTVVVTFSDGNTTFWNPYGDDVTTTFTNSATITFKILNPEGEVTVGSNTLNPETARAVSHNATSAIFDQENEIGILGYTYVNNRGSSDSAPQTAKLSFDTEVLGVMAVNIVCAPNTIVTSAHVKTVSGIDKDVVLSKRCNAYGGSTMISYVDLGLERFDYISELEWDIGVIPAATQLVNSSTTTDGIMYYGRRLNIDEDGKAFIEVFNTENPEDSTGVATITSKLSKAGTIDVVATATKVVNAGSRLDFDWTIRPWGTSYTLTYTHNTPNPIIYIRSEARDASGNFLPLSNIKVTNGASRGNEDITDLFGQINYYDTESARVYVLDGRNVTNGKAGLMVGYVSESGNVSHSELNLTYSIETELTTPDQTYNLQDMVFVQDDRATSMQTHYNKGDIYGLTNGEGVTTYPATTNYYQIRGWSSIGVENSGKHTSSDSWLTWTEGSNPITIGSAEGSLADMKVTMINTSGVDVPGPTTIYLPIPKKGQNWGTLNYNESAFEFSTALTGIISNSDTNHFEIAYGRNVTPSDNGVSLQSENDKFTNNTAGWTSADWEEVNCIKITATNIPANNPGVADNYNFIYQLEVTDAANASDGAVDTWRPLYFQQLTNSVGDIFAGWYKGSYVSVKLADGKIFGQIFIDANENGKKDSGEQDLKEAGWKLDLYDKALNRLVRSTTTDDNGKYSFIELAMNNDGYYITAANKHPIDATDVSYLFSVKGDASNTGAYNTDNQAEGNKTSIPAHTTAYIGPISPSQTSGEATYNIGVVEYVATEAYSGVVTFDDQNNRYNTRPENITITATANDGSTQRIVVPTNGDGSWSQDLPKYNDKGEKLSYSFATPEQTNYVKTDTASGHTYNVTFMQKTATLTVNHYKKGTTDKLANTETSTVYWGQTYETSQANVDDNYEYDSILGTASAVVSGDVTVNYYYKLKRGTVITHYYIKGTTTKISDDVSVDYDYTNSYEAAPLATIPTAYQNYELVSDEPEGYKGIVKAPTTEVTYYYQKKDATLNSQVSIEAPEFINNKTAAVPYSINYEAQLKDYIGDLTITLVDKLPYPIDEEQSELDNGDYDAETQTITWTLTKTYNTYSDGETIKVEHEIELVYVGAAARDSLLNTIEGNIALEGKDHDTADSAETSILTPAKIIFRFTDPYGNEIMEEIEEGGNVGDSSKYRPVEIPGYRLIADEDIDYTFGEEEKIIIYHYVAIENPKTTDDSLLPYFIVLGSTFGLGVGLIVRRRMIRL